MDFLPIDELDTEMIGKVLTFSQAEMGGGPSTGILTGRLDAIWWPNTSTRNLTVLVGGQAIPIRDGSLFGVQEPTHKAVKPV